VLNPSIAIEAETTEPSQPAPPTGLPFDYGGIPDGYYDRVLYEGNGVRRAWHLAKFERVFEYLPPRANQALLDIGCFAGSFLSLAPPERFSRQGGVDILPAQIAYATARYGTPFRSFRHVESIASLSGLDDRFDCVTLIEVIEHLSETEIQEILRQISRVLAPGGKLVLTTPNYTSAWPLLEQILNRVSDVSYQEQHITRFNYFNMERRLAEIYPSLTSEFEVDVKTTTHFVTPFLAALSLDLARSASRAVPHARWKLPFGNLILLALTRR
jgi:2-polyprenyl-3-methyl-5-hydroxy-6-metoxy-1,4-benzoquinol methylase